MGSALAGGLLVGVVGLVGLGWGAGALASSSSPRAHATATVPDLTGHWRNVTDPGTAPAWHLVTSNGLQTLNATWRGGPGHTHLRGTFQGTLTQTHGANGYTGPFTVNEDTT